jgi:hypothetical protein
MVDNHVIDSAWDDTEYSAAYNLFLNTNTRSQGFLSQRVSLNLANDHADRPAGRSGLVHLLTRKAFLNFIYN